MIPFDKFREECGVVAVYAHPEAETIAYLGLHALQHRGQESAGIVTTNGERLFAHKTMGLVQAGFSSNDLRALPGRTEDALPQVEGASSLLFLTEDELIAVRDPMGIRPLVLGVLPSANAG